MEKDYRLFVKNLPLNIDDDGLKKIFHKYVTIKKIDLKEKKALNNKVNKFAFVNVTTTDKGLYECFGKLNGERFNGFKISVELAKESFLDRLKREREESNQKKESPKDDTKPLVFENLIISTKSKHKKFDDVDFSSKEFEVEKVKKKRKSSVDDTNDLEAVPVQSLEDVEYKIKVEETNDSLIVEKIKGINKLDVASTDINNVHKIKKVKKANEFNNNKPMKYPVPVHEKPVSESEQKRLMSLKEKKKVFKAQGKVIQNALKSVDEAKLNKKIVFDDDIDIENSNEITQKSSKQKNALFESDSEEEEEQFGWNEEEIEAKANTKKKLLKMQTSIGNDKRFVLDERFVDEDDNAENVKESINPEQNDDPTLDEKKWTLGILEQVLGKPIAPPTATSSDTVQPKKKMIRYDPTADGHEKYEVVVEKSKEEKRKKKKKKIATEEAQEQEAPIPTSKEIFYDVSDKLADSFKPAEGFSLLKTLGRDEKADKPKTEPVKGAENNDESGFQFNFTNHKNPFNYDSSDHEDGKEKGGDDYSFKLNSNANKIVEDDDKLFTPLGDSKVEALNKFFNTPATVDEETFKHRRRELKKIVRTKIRNNVKKATPWNKKKVWKEKKKRR